MVARTPPPRQRNMVVPLDPVLLRETVNKVEKCMDRLHELQYITTGGTKVVSGVKLSPRSTRGYLRTSLRCKQESLRIRNANGRKSPPGKLPTTTGEWSRMSLPAMLLGETVGEILKASRFARDIVAVLDTTKNAITDVPKTPMTSRRRLTPENSQLRARRKREKQGSLRSESGDNTPPPQQRPARSRIKFINVDKEQECGGSGGKKENCRYAANRVSPKNRPWAKKTVLFPNPLYYSSSPTSPNQRFIGKTTNKSPQQPVTSRSRQITTTPHKFLIKSPARSRQTPHKFLIKSPTAKAKSPPSSAAKFHLKKKIKSPPVSVSVSPTRRPLTSLNQRSPPKKQQLSTAAKLRRSFSPSRLANRLVSLSPLKSRKSVQRKSESGTGAMLMMMRGLKERPPSSVQLSARRI